VWLAAARRFQWRPAMWDVNNMLNPFLALTVQM
jgi:hypothetical protein